MQGFGCFHKAIDRNLVRKVHRWGKQINAWTVNTPKRQAKLIRFGVDGITADDPE